MVPEFCPVALLTGRYFFSLQMATELAPRVKIVPHFVPGTIYFIAYSFQVEWKASKLSSMSAGERFRLRSGLDAKWAELAEEARKAMARGKKVKAKRESVKMDAEQVERKLFIVWRSV